MGNTASYPNADIVRDAAGAQDVRARIVGVQAGSPADDAGFSPGCYLTSVDGQLLRDVIDWRWLSAGDEVELGYIDLDGDAGTVQLWRDPGEDWGFEFDGLVFDRVRQCRNACTFCFMHQLPRGMRRSLYLRDDDFRLSFLVGTFVTCTNLTAEDEARIIEQRISPLRVSLQAANPDVRERLIGRHAQHGRDALERLLAAGIQFHAQIVLVPGENDGDALRETLDWAYAHPGILAVGIVPLGYTRFQTRFTRSFNDPAASRSVLELVEPYQRRAQDERGTAWVFAADEFYRNAWGAQLLDNLPPAEFYGDFSMFEDGIGIIRSTVDDWEEARQSRLIASASDALRQQGKTAFMVAGCAQREFLDALIARSDIGDVFRPLYVDNRFFGGNVDVTGLLTGQDIVSALQQLTGQTAYQLESPMKLQVVEQIPQQDGIIADAQSCKEAGKSHTGPAGAGQTSAGPASTGPASAGPTSAGSASTLVLVPRVVFNDDGFTLDDMTLEDMERQAGVSLHMVSCSPRDYFNQIACLAGASE